MTFTDYRYKYDNRNLRDIASCLICLNPDILKIDTNIQLISKLFLLNGSSPFDFTHSDLFQNTLNNFSNVNIESGYNKISESKGLSPYQVDSFDHTKFDEHFILNGMRKPFDIVGGKPHLRIK